MITSIDSLLLPEEQAAKIDSAPRKKRQSKPDSKMTFIKLPYELSASSKIPVLAVLAELSIRRFKSLDKKEPIKLGNVKLKTLGISPKLKVRALKQLEAAGFIKVQWNEKESPLIYFNN